MFVIFTDVDGTLIDHTTYSMRGRVGCRWRASRQRGVPLVLCSSKTRAEVERLQRDLGTAHPFVTRERRRRVRAARLLPVPIPGARRRGRYDVIELGRPYDEVVEALRRASAQ